MTLIPIGQFSKMTRLSAKALRIYADAGLLEPALVDASSGYRYYELGQANRAEAIRVLRSLDLPVSEIGRMLDSNDAEAVQNMLGSHRERLTQQIATQERMLSYLESLINRNEGIMPYEVVRKETESQLVAATRFHTSMSKVASDIGQGFGVLMLGLSAVERAPTGMPLLVFHDIIDEGNDGEIEICVPVSTEFARTGEVYCRELEGGSMVSTTHHGPYEQIAPAYHTIMAWLAEHELEPVGPPRETYLNDPQTTKPEDLQTLLEFPICDDA